MKSICRFLWVLPVLALGSGLYHGIAQEFMAPARGNVLILQRNLGAFEGEIQRKGKIYVIRKKYDNGLVSERDVPAQDVLRLCQDWDEAVRFMRSQADLKNPDERIRLAEWCTANRLLEYAREETLAALKLRPEDNDLKYKAVALERLIAANLKKQTAEPQPKVLPPAPQVDVDQESMISFQKKAQIILLNSCGQCHAAGKGGDFQLYRLSDGSERSTTMRNLDAAIRHVNFDKAQSSPLLFKATSMHGNQSQAAIRTRNAVQYQILQAWVEDLVARNPHLAQSDGCTKPARQTPAARSSMPFQTNPDLPVFPGTLRKSSLPEPEPQHESVPGFADGQIVSYLPQKLNAPAAVRSAFAPVVSQGDKRPAHVPVNPKAAAPVEAAPPAEVVSRTSFRWQQQPTLPENAVGLPVPLDGRNRAFAQTRPEFPAEAAVPNKWNGNMQTPPQPPPFSPAPTLAPPATIVSSPSAIAPNRARTDEYDPRGFNEKLQR